MKKAFTLLEIFLVLTILSFLIFIIDFKINTNNLDAATSRLVLYLKQTRYQGLIDNKEDIHNGLWHKKRWTLKFLRCRKNVGGIYYTIYSDTNMTGHPSLDESLKDPLTKKSIYSTNKCEETTNTSKYVLLTKEFGIENINISCNSTSSLGQLSFGNDGKVYSKLSSYDNSHYDYEINENCSIDLISNDNEKRTIKIEAKTGFITYKSI